MKKEKSCKIVKKMINNTLTEIPNQSLKKVKERIPSTNLVYNILDQQPATVNISQKSNRENKFLSENNGFFTPEIPKKTSFSLSPKNNYESFLPAQKDFKKNLKTLVVDLDETLVHSSYDLIPDPDIIIPIQTEYGYNEIRVLVRPYALEFIEELSNYFEIVIYTASLSRYADPLITQLDPNKNVSFRLFREHCSYVDGVYLKNLSKLGRDFKNIIIIDNSPLSYSLQPRNGIPISSWYKDKEDTTLLRLIPLLKSLAFCNDVRNEIIKFVHHEDIVWNKVEEFLEETKFKNTKISHLINLHNNLTYSSFIKFDESKREMKEIDEETSERDTDSKLPSSRKDDCIEKKPEPIINIDMIQDKFNNLLKNKSLGAKQSDLLNLHNSSKPINTTVSQEDTITASKLTPKSIVRSILNSNNEGKNPFRLHKYQNNSFQIHSNKKFNNTFLLNNKQIGSLPKNKSINQFSSNTRNSIQFSKTKNDSSNTMKNYISTYNNINQKPINLDNTNENDNQKSGKKNGLKSNNLNYDIFKNYRKENRKKTQISLLMNNSKSNIIDLFNEKQTSKKKIKSTHNNKIVLKKNQKLNHNKNKYRPYSKEESVMNKNIKFKNLYENYLNGLKDLGNSRVSNDKSNLLDSISKRNISLSTNLVERYETEKGGEGNRSSKNGSRIGNMINRTKTSTQLKNSSYNLLNVSQDFRLNDVNISVLKGQITVNKSVVSKKII